LKTNSLDTIDHIEKIKEMGIAKPTKNNYIFILNNTWLTFKINEFEIFKGTWKVYLALS